MYLLQGVPGSGKTTLALQFLLKAAGDGERTLHVTLSETRHEINRVARSHPQLDAAIDRGSRARPV
jgi:circadian clock protein KaiC